MSHSLFVWCSVFHLSVASFGDDDDNVQLIQTRILQKLAEPGWTQADLLTSAGENKCLNLEDKLGLWTNWDCNGVDGRRAVVPDYCNSNGNGGSAIRDKCCHDECAFLAAASEKSEQESKCLKNVIDDGTDLWDCEGIAINSTLSKYQVTKKNLQWSKFAATPAYCKYSDDCNTMAAVAQCCPDFCKPDSPSVGFPDMDVSGGHVAMKKEVIPLPDVSTVEGQSACLHTYASTLLHTLHNYACRASNGKTAVGPASCNSTVWSGSHSLYHKVRAVDSLCCQSDCNWNAEDLLTSAGENKCLELEAGGPLGLGLANWDCNGLDGRKAVVPDYCNSNGQAGSAVRDKCCHDECAALATTISRLPTTTTTTVSRCGRTMGAQTTTTPATTTTKKLDLTTTMGQTGGGSTATTTTIPGGNTNPGGSDCFGAIATFGPDFACNAKVSSFCADDSADGLDVSACCQDYCNSNQEKRSKKQDSEASWKEAEGERKSKRTESRSKRKDAESTRKKNKKESEWLSKRGAQETSNKKEEDERKTKNGHSESQKKEERSWKANRETSKENAQKREAARKAERGGSESTIKKQRAEKKTKWNGGQSEKKEKNMAVFKAKKEKRQKRNA